MFTEVIESHTGMSVVSEIEIGKQMMAVLKK